MADEERYEDEGDHLIKLRERVRAVTDELEKEAEDRVSKRDVVEKRWLTDLAQYHGTYTDLLEKELKDAKKSTLFINSTRPKTNMMSSRLSDMLFPTDDNNWAIKPTPVPELTVEAEEAARAAAEAEKAASEAPDDGQLQQEANQATSRSNQIKARMDEARKRARGMQEEIDDHLRAAKYSAQCRDIIEDGCKIGTGIIKGPVAGDRARRAWQPQQVDDGQGNITTEYAMTDVEETRPTYWRVNPWNFFPDLDATSIEDGEGNFERHLLNKKQLRKLARQPGFDETAVRRLLQSGTKDSLPTYIADLRSITGAYHDTISDRYHVWEYHGPLDMDKMRDIAMLFGVEAQNKKTMERAVGLLEDLSEYDEEVDPLDELNVILWFCQGELLKFGLYYLDSDEPVYSVFNLEKDDASVFGFGIPYIMRDPQDAMSSAWRALMDNAGLSAGPQIVINDEAVEPVNNVWVLEPRKLWRRKTGAPKDMKPFEIFEITSNIEELTQLIEFCKRNIDEETALPLIAQGEQGSHITKTLGGMSLLMNSANIVFKRIVKNWDDDITVPTIRRSYDFLMQFSPKEHIKGDFEIDARGSSVLLVREMQSQNLMLFLTNFSGHPILGKFLKKEGLEGLRHLARTMMLPADQLVLDDNEVAEMEAREARQPQPPNIEMEELTVKLNIAKEERESRRELALIERETALIKLAGEQNLALDELRAKLDDARDERRSKERQFAAEAAVTARQGPSGGGHF